MVVDALNPNWENPPPFFFLPRLAPLSTTVSSSPHSCHRVANPRNHVNISRSSCTQFHVEQCPCAKLLCCFCCCQLRDGSGTSDGGDGGWSLRPMEAEQLRECGHRMVDFIADYYKSMETFPVLSQVQARPLLLSANPAVQLVHVLLPHLYRLYYDLADWLIHLLALIHVFCK